MVKYPQKRMNGLIWESLNKGGEDSISGVKKRHRPKQNKGTWIK